MIFPRVRSEEDTKAAIEKSERMKDAGRLRAIKVTQSLSNAFNDVIANGFSCSMPRFPIP
jgi:hypothetical protein